jgi:hypothetical protein
MLEKISLGVSFSRARTSARSPGLLGSILASLAVVFAGEPLACSTDRAGGACLAQGQACSEATDCCAPLVRSFGGSPDR